MQAPPTRGGVDDRWYEKRKRAVSMALLPAPEYEHALEIGCSIGRLSAELAQRARRVSALDASGEALSQARAFLGAHAHIDFRQATVPAEWPFPGPFDVVALSETGYYLDIDDLAALNQRILGSTTEGAHLLLCHWRGHIDGWDSSAATVHHFFRSCGHWRVFSTVQERQTLFDLLVKVAPGDMGGADDSRDEPPC